MQLRIGCVAKYSVVQIIVVMIFIHCSRLFHHMLQIPFERLLKLRRLLLVVFIISKFIIFLHLLRLCIMRYISFLFSKIYNMYFDVLP